MLHIDSIELSQFQGMWLNKIKLFKLEDIKRYQLILGRNGCGKSRLMRILSLICPNKTDFDVNGYRVITVTKDSNQYELKCVRTKGGFKCTITDLTDDKVLFDAVNGTVYNTAVKELFNYDKDIHDLITGKVLFTKMSGPERKKWFSILSESDLTYALSFYKKSREHHRDLTGTIKSIKHNIGLIKPRVIENKDDLEETRLRVEAMQAEIQTLDKEIDAAGADWSINDASLDLNDAKLNEISAAILKSEMYVSKLYHENNRVDVLCTLATLDSRHSLRMEELNSIIKKVEHGSKVKNIDLSKLEDMVATLDSNITDNRANVCAFPILNGFTGACGLEVLAGASNMRNYYTAAINNAILELNQNVEHDKVAEITNQLSLSIAEAQKQLNTCRNEVTITLERVKAIDHVCNVECTNCGHSFKPGIKVGERDSLLSRISNREETIKRLESEITDSTAKYEQYLRINNAIIKAREAMETCGGNDACSILFKRLIECDVLSSSNTSLASLVDRFNNEVDLVAESIRLEQRRDKIKIDIDVIKANQSEDYTELNNRCDALNEEIATITKDQTYWKSVLAHVDSTEARMGKLEELAKQLEDTLNEREDIAKVLERNIKVTILSEERAEVWKLLIATKQRFEDMDKERQRLEMLEQDLIETTKRKDAAGQIVDAMSPDGGILARYLYQSITKVTDLMTGYVNSIWGYEMGIMPCKVKGTELDYKFPFYANDSSQITDDVSMGSTAQQEVINFVFMLSVYQAMKLDGFPLFLDELGSGFDEGHKPTMIDFIKGLIDRNYHSQVFMVSHDPQTHFQLSHADACVIDSNGITLPAVYNKNVTIEK